MEGGKVVCIGRGVRGRVLGAVGDKKVEKDGGYNCPLWDAAVDLAEFGAGGIVGAGGGSAAKVTGDPPDEIGME